MIEKLKMQTPNLTDKNIEQIEKLFPHVMTETKDENGKSKKAIDFDLLQQSLSDVLVDDENERYRLDWPGKKASLLKANTPITKTLRPCREESVNFDTTENLYIEGDNFEVLKILQESYLGKIKMIYIDPPYNTGKDFIYKDNFKISKEEYEEEIGAVDEEGDKLFKNTDSNGRFHSDWLSMMFERLTIARDLLKDDGVIFISIGDNETHNLRKICDEIFGDGNFVANAIWRSTDNSNNDAKQFSCDHNYTLIYSKNSGWQPIKMSDKSKRTHFKNPNNDPRGAYFDGNPLNSPNPRKNLTYDIISPQGHVISPPKNGWRWSKETVKEKISTGEIRFTQDGKAIRRRTYLCDMKGLPPSTLWIDLEKTGHNRQAKYELLKILPEDIFDTPKPVKLLKYIMKISEGSKEDIILDFFSGSATTAHAAMQLNAEDGGSRKFIMAQLPEKTDKNSEAFKAGYKTISEIGKERIRRAGKKIIEDNKDKEGIEKLDIGFRVYKTDTTNMKDVYYHPDEIEQPYLPGFESNIKDDRTPDDLLTQVILDLGLELNLPIEKKEILSNTVFIVQTNALVACFDNNINFKIIDEIADLKPFKVVFKDAGFKKDKDRINLEERFKRLSPETVITVI